MGREDGKVDGVVGGGVERMKGRWEVDVERDVDESTVGVWVPQPSVP